MNPSTVFLGLRIYWLFNSKDIVWPSVVTIIPDWYYDFYGDDQPLRDNYEMMKRFVLYHQRLGNWKNRSSTQTSA